MVEYTVVNVLTFVIGIGFLLNGYALVKRGQEDLPLFVLSSLIGLGLLTVAVIPNLFYLVATLIGLKLKARAILVVSNLTLFVLITYILNRAGRMHKKLSRLNEEMSLLKNVVEERNEEIERLENILTETNEEISPLKNTVEESTNEYE